MQQTPTRVTADAFVLDPEIRDAVAKREAEQAASRAPIGFAEVPPHGRIYHLIGRQGSGKSSVAALLAGALRSLQRDCPVFDGEASRHVSNAELRATMAPGDIVIVESDERNARHLDLMRGDMVITIERGGL